MMLTKVPLRNTPPSIAISLKAADASASIEAPAYALNVLV